MDSVGKNVPLKDLDVNWKSGGEFILDADGESVYYYNKNMNVSKNPDGSVTTPGGTKDPEGTIIHSDGSVTIGGPPFLFFERNNFIII